MRKHAFASVVALALAPCAYAQMLPGAVPMAPSAPAIQASSGAASALAYPINVSGGLLSYAMLGSSGATVAMNNGNNTESGAWAFPGGIASGLTPTTDNTYSLGTSSDRWATGYFGGGTTTPTTDGQGVLAQQGSKTAYSIYSTIIPPANYYYDAVRATVDSEGGAVGNHNAYGAYIYNNAAETGLANGNGAVGLFSTAVNAVAGAETWGLNPACDDSPTNSTSNSFASTCVGAEFDLTFYNTGSIGLGASFIIQGAVMPSGANALQVGAVAPYTAEWTNGLVVNDHALRVGGVALYAGTVGTSVAANVQSAQIDFQVRDSANTEHAALLGGIPFGTNSAIAVSNSAGGNGLAFVNGGATGSPEIVPTGSANESLLIAANGSGSIETVSSVQPYYDNTYSLGAPSNRWATVYGVNATWSGNVQVTANATTATSNAVAMTCAVSSTCHNNAGRFTVATGGSATAMVLTFNTAATFTNVPVCFSQDETTSLTLRATAVSTTAVTFTASGALTVGDKVSYLCMGI